MNSEIMLSIKSALMSGAIAGMVAVSGYIIGVGNVFALDVHAIINAGIMAALTTIVSLIKSSMTNSDGKVLGVKVK